MAVNQIHDLNKLIRSAVAQGWSYDAETRTFQNIAEGTSILHARYVTSAALEMLRRRLGLTTTEPSTGES